ncbi:MAG: InlB B-repeat-containing protein, partial [Paludibacteraceae bacterium]|nr:InlB B-repeat-containing protein [Paludibacteraceae bacterium]
YNGDTDLDNRTPWANGIVRISSGWSNTYYIKLDGTWYELSGNTYYLSNTTTLSGAVSCTKVHDHTDGTCTCGKEIHTHGDGNCSCSMTVHAHIDSCYTYPNCSEDAHTHTDACYSECTIPVHTHDNSCTSNRDDNVIYVVTAKYEATIGNVWPTADKFPNVTLRGWSVDGLSATAVSKRINMTSDLCDTSDGVKYAEAVTGGTKTYLYYMFESFDQTSPANGNERILRNGVYYDKSELYYQEVNSGGNWNQKEIMGMNPVNNGVVESGSNVFLYYNRLRYTLKFQNIDEVIYTENQVMFEKPLNYYLDADGKYVSSIVPSYPDSLEDGAYEFAGWYTTPECFEGTKFDFTTGKMPNGDLTLFAKWAPVKHNVTFYTSKDSATGELKDKIGDTVAVPHGSKINEQYIPQAPDDFDNGQYTFDGWFYMDNGVEKAFSFKDMTVTQELNVYARWISNKQINYIFHFELADGTVIADPVTGSGLAGETITVNAKGDTALYSNYQEGYFPNVKSHSIDLDIEDEDGLMEYTFVYSPVDAVPYTVYYVAETLKDGGTSLGTITRDGKTYYIIADTEVYDQNRKSYVVEQFKAVSGYLPDAYQKSTPIVYGETNEIIFYYTVDSIHAYYKITHYIQNLDGNSWTEHRVIQSQGMIGSVYSADPLDIPGYTYNSAIEGTMTSGTLTADGLELKLYYVRNKYPYKVVYKVQETGEILYDSTADGVIETDFFDKVISHTAPGTYGIYGLVGDATQTLVIRVEEDPKNPTLNVITFYYTERVVDLNYVIVAPDGTVYRANQTWGKLTSFGESVKVSTGKANGSTSSVESNVYKFVGWYSDPECKTRISDKVTFVPTKEDGTLWGDGTTYYAKFEYNLTSLKIQKQGHDPIDENQTFLFRITDEEGFEL